MVINISCKLEKASYDIFFIRAVMVKSLYTLRLSSGYNDLLNYCSAMPRHTGLQFHYVIADQILRE